MLSCSVHERVGPFRAAKCECPADDLEGKDHEPAGCEADVGGFSEFRTRAGGAQECRAGGN